MLKQSLLVFAALCATAALGQTHQVDAKKSELAWFGKKVLVSSSHNGLIAIKNGQVDTKDGKVTGLKIVADMATIESLDMKGKSGKEKLEGHLKNSDFFDVKKYPTSSFTSTSVTPIKGKAGQYLVKGNFTVKGKTNPISFTATEKAKPMRHLVADFSFDRTKWDVRYGSGKFFTSLGDKVIADAIAIKSKITY